MTRGGNLFRTSPNKFSVSFSFSKVLVYLSLFQQSLSYIKYTLPSALYLGRLNFILIILDSHNLVQKLALNSPTEVLFILKLWQIIFICLICWLDLHVYDLFGNFLVICVTLPISFYFVS
jgi:hypothetical protein